VGTLGILEEKSFKSCLLIIPIRMGNEITKFNMLTDWKLDCLVNELFPIRRMKDILNDACGVGVFKMILLKFEMFEFDGSCYLKYCHIVRLRFG
jgi:hypothetical protein